MVQDTYGQEGSFDDAEASVSEVGCVYFKGFRVFITGAADSL